MSGKMIFYVIMIVLLTISAAITTSHLFAAFEDVRIAEQELEKTKAEYAETQRNIQGMIDEVVDKQ